MSLEASLSKAIKNLNEHAHKYFESYDQLEIFKKDMKSLIRDETTKFDQRLKSCEEDVVKSSPTGTVIYLATSTPPKGWLKANGAAISRTAYKALFEAIGITYGKGDGSGTFNLPDLRGEFVRGFDDGRGVDKGRILGTAQIASHIQVDDDTNEVVGALSQNKNNTIAHGLEPSQINLTILHYGKSVTDGVQVGSHYLRTVRPRNVSLLACIKY